MIRRIVGSNQVATPTMATPPEPINSKMTAPPEPDKTHVQTQADGSVAPQLQQSALQRAGEQRLQASLLQTELLRKLGSPPEPIKESGPGDERAIKEAVDAYLPIDSERLMNSIKDTTVGDSLTDIKLGEQDPPFEG